ncbi:hypothetical protein DFH08DRAFT_834360 [Mycena albidolilacea]|uniref:DUF6533 domain-containing protein n=1 Tax=Mycena albidolilacea TaxID=1033008 RepID=A0AAD7AR35_9AGAR|nr:hypothetical protein DFH08DRAFT_834360 [Mycena albidolilacea]
MAVPNVHDDICVGFAAFTILIWDHIDTLATEVEYIWKGKKGIIVYLFLLNRYLTPLGFMVNLFAYLSPVWTNEGAMTVIGIHVVGIMMLLRIGALYSTQRIVIGAVFVLWLVMFSVNASTIASSSAWLPLLYDSVVLVLTLRKTLPLLKKGSGTFMVKRLLEDGLIYYAAIFSVTLVLTIMIISAPPGLKNIAAQITVTMMSRITLNLKKCAQERLQSTILRDPGSIVFRSVVSAFPTTPVDAERGYRNPDW